MGDFTYCQSCLGPSCAENLGLFQDKLGCPCLLVRRVTVTAEDSLDNHAHLGAYVLADNLGEDTRVASRSARIALESMRALHRNMQCGTSLAHTGEDHHQAAATGRARSFGNTLMQVPVPTAGIRVP